MSKGKVYLVGAGPGDIGLLTCKAREIIAQADVVVYDRLIGNAILASIPSGTKVIDVGKRAGNHTMPQDEINRTLVEQAQKGYCVVRLKGGDPFMFGRGGEEVELLVKEQIPYEIIPGVPSPIAVPAYNGIPVTHRDFCSSVHIITGHKKAGEAYNIDFEALVRTKGTLIFLMGITALGDICGNLIAAGMDPSMPAAVLQQGTTARQKKIVATLDTLVTEVERQGVETPAIIVVGRVCELADSFSWTERLPLFGRRIVLTRPRKRSSQMAALLRAEGAEVLEIPAIKTVAIDKSREITEAFSHLSQMDWIVLTSPEGADLFFEKMKEAGQDIRTLASCRFAVIGQGTKRRLGDKGILADLMPKVYDGISLGKSLAGVIEKEGGEHTKVLIPRAEKGNQELVTLLADTGAEVYDVPIYRTQYEKPEAVDIRTLYENHTVDCTVFTSASTVEGFLQVAGDMDPSLVRAACIGEQTARAAQHHGIECNIAQEATLESLTTLVKEMTV